jgi:hypothetical protein
MLNNHRCNYFHKNFQDLILDLSSGNISDAIFCIQNGADVNIKDNNGNTALILGILIHLFKFTFFR